MRVYIIALLISVLFAWFYTVYVRQMSRIDSVGDSRYLIERVPEKNKVVMFFLGLCSMLPLTLVSAFREGVGRDFYTSYVYSYYYQLDGQGYFSDEIIYDLLEKVLVVLNASYTWVFIITSLIVGIFYYFTIFKYGVSPVYSIILLFLTSIYFIGMNGVRQGISMAIAFLGIEKLKEG